MFSWEYPSLFESKDIFIVAWQHKLSSEYVVQCWLEEHGLGHYFETFLLNDIRDMMSVSQLQLTESCYDDMEMHIPAHRKRLRKAGESYIRFWKTEEK